MYIYMYRVYKGFILGIYRVCARYIKSRYRVYTGYMEGLYQGYTRYIQGIYRLYTGYNSVFVLVIVIAAA